MMEIIFLGTGDAFSKQYYQTNLLLRFNDTNLLIDCGSTCSTSLYHLGIPLGEIQNVFISHLHSDHIGGLEELALQNRYVFRKKVNLFIAENLAQDIWDCCLRGGLEYTEDGLATLDDYFNVYPVAMQFTIADRMFEIIPTMHIRDMKTYGLYFNRIFYTDDTIFNEPMLLQMDPRCDLIIHDCTFKENPVHTYFDSLASLPEEIRKKIYITHYNDKSEMMRAKTKQYGIRCAEKHMCIKIHEKEDGTWEVAEMMLKSRSL